MKQTYKSQVNSFRILYFYWFYSASVISGDLNQVYRPVGTQILPGLFSEHCHMCATSWVSGMKSILEKKLHTTYECM